MRDVSSVPGGEAETAEEGGVSDPEHAPLMATLTVDLLRQELARLQRAIRRLDEGMNGPPGKRLSLESIAKRLEQLAERAK